MKITSWFEARETGAVLVDCSANSVVRAFAAVPLKGNTGRAVRRFFPDAYEVGHGIVRLGGWQSFPSAVSALVEAKMSSYSPTVQGLHLVEGRGGVGMSTIPHNLLVG